VTGVSVFSAPFRAESSWIGISCIFNGFVFDFYFSFFYLVRLADLFGVERSVPC